MSLINTIACGDCREILPTLPAKSFQLAFADPPYWVGFDYGNKTDKEMSYIEPDFLVSELLRISEVVLVTPGMRHFYDYPKCDWILSWNKPASTGQSKLGGFCVWEPVLVYGIPKKKVWQDSFTALGGREFDADFHACPKPLSLLKWLIENFTEPNQNVIDPTSGSGTTCKAAFQLGRGYFGIEIDPNIAELSRQRLLQSQPPLLAVGGLTPRAADGYAASQQSSLFAVGDKPAKVSGAKRRR